MQIDTDLIKKYKTIISKNEIYLLTSLSLCGNASKFVNSFALAIFISCFFSDPFILSHPMPIKNKPIGTRVIVDIPTRSNALKTA